MEEENERGGCRPDTAEKRETYSGSLCHLAVVGFQKGLIRACHMGCIVSRKQFRQTILIPGRSGQPGQLSGCRAQAPGAVWGAAPRIVSVTK